MKILDKQHTKMKHKAGFVNIIGNPNVGKSTIMNAMVDERLSIITSKAQTTRHRILGIVNGEDFQIVYSDTPGILQPKYKLQESMMAFVKTALEDADVFLFVTDVFDKAIKNEMLIEKIAKKNVPIIVLINKIDLSNQQNVVELMQLWQKKLPNAEIIPISGLNKFNLEKVFNSILDKIPESPPYFSKDALTDKSERFFVSEIIRGKILENYQKEIPYSVEVEVEKFKELEKIINIKSLIYVERDSQKGIIIGHQGKALKNTATKARHDLEAFFGKKVFLEIYVKVDKDWRTKENKLKRFGYIQ